MGDSDPYKRYAHLPIPTYEEAIVSRPSSSQNTRGPTEVSDDAERQGLLLGGEGGNGDASQSQRGYQPPTAESPRNSDDSDLRLPEMGSGDDDRRNIEELDYLEPGEDESGSGSSTYHRARIRNKLSQRWYNISSTFSNIRLPRLRTFYTTLPSADEANPTPTVPETTEPWLVRAWSKIPSHYRLSASTAARLCGLATISTVVYILFVVLDISPRNHGMNAARFDPESVRQFVQDQIQAGGESGNIQGWLHHITSYDHVAGTKGDFILAEWMEARWRDSMGFDNLALLEYFVYLNYPREDGSGRSVTMVTKNQEEESDVWHATLEEDKVYPDKEQPYNWHGYSKSGIASGHLIYANGGSREDFQWLKDKGVQTEGSVALVRYFATQGDRSLKVKAAEEAGCVGVLIYSDPSDDGDGKGAVWPEGPWRPEDSVQRGSVGLGWIIGDPLTPGWASTPDAKRVGKDDNPGLNNIPSLPLSWKDAQVLLRNLTGSGEPVPKSWKGGNAAFPSSETWWTGAAADERSPWVEMHNELDEIDKQRIWNLHGLIEGTENPNMKIIVGNHRDSWCFGSVDPGSGSAVMMELVTVFGELRRQGWRPLRTIEFVSWDAEEYNYVGSTEYVEDNLEYLRDHAVGYLNVDVGVFGPDFRAAGSPVYEKPLMRVLDRIADPKSNGTATLRKAWADKQSRLKGLGGGSDYVPFQDIAGTSSIDFGFEGAENGYPYHSCYESLDWMAKFGDPGFSYHRALAQIWALLILEMADHPLIPYDLRSYATAMHKYIDNLAKDATAEYASQSGKKDITEKQLSSAENFTVAPLREAAKVLSEKTEMFHRFEDLWTAEVLGRGGFETTSFAMKRMEYNRRIARFDTDLLDIAENMNHGAGPSSSAEKKAQHGVPGREQYKHVVFAPQTWSGYDEGIFPAVRDALAARDWKAAMEQVEKVAGIIEMAAENLVR